MNARTSPSLAAAVLSTLWTDAGLPSDALADLTLTGAEPVLPSSFAIGTALQASLGAAALAAARIGQRRSGPRQSVSVDATAVAQESSAWFRLDGRTPTVWDPLSGLYACGSALHAPGWVRIHANFAHHRDGALRLLGLSPGAQTSRAAVADALRHWRAEDFEQAAADAGQVVAAVRSFEQWDAHPQAAAVAARPLVALQRLDDAPALPWPALTAGDRPLQGLRVLDLTRILAGPVAGRTLAAYGAEVMLVNGPHLPNIESIAETSRGKLSVQLDLRSAADRGTLRTLVQQADVFVQGYRPGGLAALGFGPADLARLKPGIVAVSLSAYGDAGPWAGRRGFDSLVQTATGFNHAEAQAHAAAEPKAMPLQVLDYSAGFLLAFGAQAALLRRAQEGGSWHVQVSLARTGHWLRSLGRCTGFADVPRLSFDGVLETTDSGFGSLEAVRHAARFSHTPAHWSRPSVPPGTHAPVWPSR